MYRPHSAPCSFGFIPENKESVPFDIQDGVGLIVDTVDEHVSLSVIHPALFIHMELENRRHKRSQVYTFIH